MPARATRAAAQSQKNGSANGRGARRISGTLAAAPSYCSGVMTPSARMRPST